MLLKELQTPNEIFIRLWCDNKTAINIIHNLVHHNYSKYVDVDRYFIKKIKLKKELTILYSHKQAIDKYSYQGL